MKVTISIGRNKIGCSDPTISNSMTGGTSTSKDCSPGFLERIILGSESQILGESSCLGEFYCDLDRGVEYPTIFLFARVYG